MAQEAVTQDQVDFPFSISWSIFSKYPFHDELW